MTGLPVAGRPPARIGRRIAGFVVDRVPLVLGAAAVGALVVGRLESGATADVLAPLAAYWGLSLVYGIGLWWWLATAGLSPGKRLLGMRVVSAGTGRPIGWGPAFLRQLVLGLVTGLTLGVGALVLAAVAARDPRRRGWHDRAAGSVVVDERAAPAPPPPPAAPRTVPGIVPVGLPAGAGAPRAVDAATGPAGRPSADPLPPAPPAATWPPAAPPPAAAPPLAAPPPTARPPVAPPPPTSSPGQASGSGLISTVPGLVDDVPGIRRSGPAGPPPPTPSSPPPPEPQDDPELTRLPGPRAPAVGPWTLTVGGHPMTVRGTGLLGRDPQPRAGEEVAHLVPVDDPQRSLSKTHLAFGADADGFWVCDRGSTNGSVVRMPDGRPVPCPPDTPVRVPSGSTVVVGDHELQIGVGHTGPSGSGNGESSPSTP